MNEAVDLPQHSARSLLGRPEMIQNCRLCAAIQEGLGENGSSKPENTVLAKSASFVLMPCIGALVPGHAMIVSHGHYQSLAAMKGEAVEEYDAFVRSLDIGRFNTLEVEHGATREDCAGACVVHTHVHVMPGMSQFAEALDGAYELLHRGEEIVLPTPETPYIFLRGSLGEARIHDACGLPSQFIRQVICGSLGRADWDWREAPPQHLVSETIEFWRQRDG